jgi:two-component sensor histidine kinase
MNQIYALRQALGDKDRALLLRIEASLPILADLSRADLLLYLFRVGPATEALVVAEAKPHSVPAIYPESLLGKAVTPQEEPVIFRALSHGHSESGISSVMVRGTVTVREVFPVRGPSGLIFGALNIETNLVERERHRHRSPVFRQALADLQQMALRGELEGVESLSPFWEHDGILFVDQEGQIRYVSGVAETLYRKLGYADSLLKCNIRDLETNESVFYEAVLQKRCVEREHQEKQLTWVRKGIPIFTPLPRGWRRRLLQRGHYERKLGGVLLTVHDETDARRKEQELRIKSAMIQEIHHRVKNNLQTIAALLRLQARRMEYPEAQERLEESVNRILSVAVVHEFLSHDEGSTINMKEVSQRIVELTEQGIMDPSKGIKLLLKGFDVSLPAQQATACALVINELLQNAVEHGYTDRVGGCISITLARNDREVRIEIADDGEGLPPGFDLNQSATLGLKIVQTLVKEDLKGTFELSNGKGVRALVRFPTLSAQGEAK